MENNILPARTWQTRLNGLLRLSRWKEHILFTVPLTLLGANLAAGHHPDAVTLDWRLLAVTIANVLAVTLAFMVNDVEDAPDDAREAARAARNPVTSGEITRREGWLASIVVSGVALVCYAWTSEAAFWNGVITVALAYLYSWRTVRLKALPVVDVISHILMLSALLFLAGYFAYHDDPGRVWLVALAVGLVSVYGQLYNQLRDYDMDRAAGLHNTASVLGPRLTQMLMYGSLIAALACLAITIAWGLWPLWLVVVPVVMAPLLIFFRPSTDMRGTEAIDVSGRVQLGFILIANATVLVWLVAHLLD